MRWEGESRMGIVAHSKWMESWGGEVGVKRRERDLAGFEALVVCDGEVFCFFFPFSREIMTEPSVGVFVLDILIFFFFFLSSIYV